MGSSSWPWRGRRRWIPWSGQIGFSGSKRSSPEFIEIVKAANLDPVELMERMLKGVGG